MNNTYSSNKRRSFFMIPCGIILALLFVWGVQLLWNILMPEIFGLKMISFGKLLEFCFCQKFFLEVLDLKVEDMKCVMDSASTIIRNIVQMMIDPNSKQNGNVDFQRHVGTSPMMSRRNNNKPLEVMRLKRAEDNSLLFFYILKLAINRYLFKNYLF